MITNQPLPSRQNVNAGFLLCSTVLNKDLHKRNMNIGFQCGRSGSHGGHNGYFLVIKQATGPRNVTTYVTHYMAPLLTSSQNFVKMSYWYC